jgi:hypothetical protein
MDDKTIVNVTNRDAGQVVYSLPDRGIKRTFNAGESKKIELEELRQLSYATGGEFLLKNCLVVNNTDALSALNIEVEPEYFYTEAEVKTLLTTGTLDELEDCLNFAPEGVIDLVKKIAVDEEIPDTRKRKLITEKTGFSIDNAINVNHIMSEETEETTEAPTKTRKAAPLKTAASVPVRKAAASKYKVVSEGK